MLVRKTGTRPIFSFFPTRMYLLPLVLIMFCISQSVVGQTHYVFDGTGLWGVTGFWTPSYPGKTIASTDTVTVTSTSILTLVPGIVSHGTFINEGEMHAADGKYLAANGLLVNNGAYFVAALGATSEPSFVALDLINNGTLDIQNPAISQPEGMHIHEFTNNGVFTGAGWNYISTYTSIVNNGMIDHGLLQMESGYFENNDTLQGGVFGYGEHFSGCPGDTNVFVNYGYVGFDRGFMPCMKRIENHGVFISPDGYYVSDTLINTNYLEMVLKNFSNSGIYASDVFINSGYAWLRDGVGSSKYSFNHIINSDTLIIDSTNIVVDSTFQNSGHFIMIEDWISVDDVTFQNFGDFKVSNGSMGASGVIQNFGNLILDGTTLNSQFLDYPIDLTVFNFTEGVIEADTVFGAEIINDGKLSIGRPSANLSTGPQLNSGIIQLTISGSAEPGADGGYQRIQAEGDVTLIGSNTLEVILDDYSPVLGDSFTLVQCSNLLGVFSPILLPNIDGCLGWNTIYSSDKLILYVGDSPDSDSDGTLDCDDLCPNDPLKIDPGVCGCDFPDLDSDQDGKMDCLDTDVMFARQSNSSLEGVRISGQTADSTQLWYLGSVTDSDTSVMLMNRFSDPLQFGTGNKLRMTLDEEGRVGIGKAPSEFRLEVNGQASKSTPGDWLANSDARLKRNIQSLDGMTTLNKLRSLEGVTYVWDDDKLYDRPAGIQYGLTAQNVQQVYPELVQRGEDGWLVTSYGTFDPMFLAAFKALSDDVESLRSTIRRLTQRLEVYENVKPSSIEPKIERN